MKLSHSAVLAASLAIGCLCTTSPAYAQEPTVTFSDVNDGVRGRFFSAAKTVAVGNRLIIGFDSGLDFRTFKYLDFRASTASFSYGTAHDTLSVRIQAPEGYYISKVTYIQRGFGSVIRTGKASGAASWVVDDFAEELGDFSTSPALTRTLDLSSARKTFVPVSVTAALFAFSTPLLGSASVQITGAEIVVEILPLDGD